MSQFLYAQRSVLKNRTSARISIRNKTCGLRRGHRHRIRVQNCLKNCTAAYYLKTKAKKNMEKSCTKGLKKWMASLLRRRRTWTCKMTSSTNCGGTAEQIQSTLDNGLSRTESLTSTFSLLIQMSAPRNFGNGTRKDQMFRC